MMGEIETGQGEIIVAIANGGDDFTPFRNIMNEFYARDTSRKIKSVLKG